MQFEHWTNNTSYGFIWDATKGMVNLNDLLGSLDADWTLSELRGINSSGQIVGFGRKTSGFQRAFLLTPSSVSQPGNFLLFGLLSLVGLARRGRCSLCVFSTTSLVQREVVHE